MIRSLSLTLVAVSAAACASQVDGTHQGDALAKLVLTNANAKADPSMRCIRFDIAPSAPGPTPGLPEGMREVRQRDDLCGSSTGPPAREIAVSVGESAA